MLLPGKQMSALRHVVTTFLVAAACVVALSGCAGTERTEPGVLRINLGGEPPSLDWHVSTDSTSFDVVSNLMVGLTQYRNDLSCAPACAERWEILDKGRRYIFHLRKNLKWSDGKPLLAGDFVYAWHRILNPATGAAYAYFLYDVENAFEFNTRKLNDAEKIGIHALDDYTLEVRLKKPASYFIYLTAFCPTYPMRKDVVERGGTRWTDPEYMVSNGPFLLKDWKHEYKIEIEANPHFFEGKPKISKIKMFMIPEQSTAFALYENNQLDFIDNRSFPTPEVHRNRNSPEYRNFLLLRNNYLGFNVKKAPFTDKRVRQAFSMAIDRSVFPKILRRSERPSDCWIPQGLAGHSEDSGPKFDPERARQLLAEAGFPDGKGFPEVTVLYPTREDTRLVMEAVQDQLKQNLHIHVELTNQEWKVYLQTLRGDAPPMYRASWGADYPDPETFMNIFTSYNGNNDTRWKSSRYDALVSQAAGEQNAELRAELYRKADQLLCKDETPIIVTYLATQNVMIKPGVHGIGINPLDLQFFKDASVDGSP